MQKEEIKSECGKSQPRRISGGDQGEAFGPAGSAEMISLQRRSMIFSSTSGVPGPPPPPGPMLPSPRHENLPKRAALFVYTGPVLGAGDGTVFIRDWSLSLARHSCGGVNYSPLFPKPAAPVTKSRPPRRHFLGGECGWRHDAPRGKSFRRQSFRSEPPSRRLHYFFTRASAPRSPVLLWGSSLVYSRPR